LEGILSLDEEVERTARFAVADVKKMMQRTEQRRETFL
jgi:hypothetical protein